MKHKTLFNSLLVLIVALGLVVGGSLVGLPQRLSAQGLQASGTLGPGAALGTAFTYQGYLEKDGGPVDDTCDLSFRLYAASSGGSPLATDTVTGVKVADGFFNAQVDFGAGVFTGDARWLEVAVQCTGDGDFALLDGRVPLTAAPYATYAAAAPWSGLTGVPAGFADGVDDDTTYTAGTGLNLAGTEFSVHTDTIQVRVSATCSAGSSIRAIAQDGTVTCEADDDTTYTAGTGLSLAGTQFGVGATYRLPQGCAGGQIAEWNGSSWECGNDDGGGTGSFWSLSGNADTTPGTDFLGTTDDQALELHVNGSRALRLAPDGTSPNLVGGYGDNSVTAGVHGATIGGGGGSGDTNRVTDHYGTVGGGSGNQAGDDDDDLADATYVTVAGDATTVAGGSTIAATGAYATVGGGYQNTASGYASTVGGGSVNTASGNYDTVSGGTENTASGDSSIVGGGYRNTASGYASTLGGGRFNTASGYNSTVGGGYENTASGYYSTVGGGDSNTASGWGSTMGGGEYNTASGAQSTVAGGSYITATGDLSTVGGGYYNTASGYASAVGGGYRNIVTATYATLGGGWYNTASGAQSTVGGGQYNTASGDNSTVGGGSINTASGWGATVGGGVSNTATGAYATVGGGELVYVTGDAATVAGGSYITATGDYATVGGGYRNTASGYASTLGGGVSNTASGAQSTLGGGTENTASGYASTLGGGQHNTATGAYATVGGGYHNIVTATYATVGGGDSNTASGSNSTVGGGWYNIASGDYSTVGGGWYNTASGYASTLGGGEHVYVTGEGATVAGGSYITATGDLSTVGGGQYNTASGWSSTVGGGVSNIASGYASTVAGGEYNTASSSGSFAAGTRARASHDGAFVWGDYTWSDIQSPANNTFIVRANGGMWFGRATTAFTPTIDTGVFLNTSTGGYLSDGGSWVDSSDRDLKENFAPVDPQDVLARVVELPVTTWNYKAEDAGVRHMGPVAQDFYAAFALGQDDRHIASLDGNGVALVAIQGLYEVAQAQEVRIAELEQENAALRAEFLSNRWFGLLGLLVFAAQWGWRRRDAFLRTGVRAARRVLLRALRGGGR